MLKLVKILNSFKIKNKLLKIVIDNASSNNTLKNELERILNRQEY